jgi:hypothetical protein
VGINKWKGMPELTGVIAHAKRNTEHSLSESAPPRHKLQQLQQIYILIHAVILTTQPCFLSHHMKRVLSMWFCTA